jgi:hypothetical protein
MFWLWLITPRAFTFCAHFLDQQMQAVRDFARAMRRAQSQRATGPNLHAQVLPLTFH